MGTRSVQKLDLIDLLWKRLRYQVILFTDALSFGPISSGGYCHCWMEPASTPLCRVLLEENRVLREQIGSRRMRFNDDQRRNHQGLGNRLIVPMETKNETTGAVGVSGLVDC